MTRYATGEEPKRGDHIRYTDQDPNTRYVNKEAREVWVVTSICDDMVRAKCLDAETWRQAFYTAQMSKVSL